MTDISPFEACILFLGIAVYFGLVLLDVRVAQPLLLSVGVVAFTLAYVVPRELGPIDRPGREPIAIMVGAFLLLAMPVAWAPAPRGPGALAAAVGVLTTQAIWAVHRYPADAHPTRHRQLGADLMWGLRWGLAMAVAFSAYAGFVFLLVSLRWRQNLFSDVTLPLIIVGYFGGGFVGGAVAGLVRPLAHRPLGAMLMGVLVALPVYESIALIMPLIDDEARNMSFLGQLGIGVACALMAGPPAALSLRRRRSRRSVSARAS